MLLSVIIVRIWGHSTSCIGRISRKIAGRICGRPQQGGGRSMGQGSIDRVSERSVIKQFVGALGRRTTKMAAVQQGRNVVDIAAGHFAFSAQYCLFSIWIDDIIRGIRKKAN